MKGLVIKNTGSWYVVRTDDGQFFDCKVKGNFRLKGIRSTNPVAVGDRVSITPSSMLNAEGAESEKRERRGNAQCSMNDGQRPTALIDGMKWHRVKRSNGQFVWVIDYYLHVPLRQ